MSDRYDKMAEAIVTAWHPDTSNPFVKEKIVGMAADLRRIDAEPEAKPEPEPEPVYPLSGKFIEAIRKVKIWYPSDELRAAMEQVLACDRDAVLKEAAKAVDGLANKCRTVAGTYLLRDAADQIRAMKSKSEPKR